MSGPLDEQQWSRPEMPQWYVSEGQQNGFPWANTYMHENLIHRYLAESIYFDYTTKNGMPIDQSRKDLDAWNLTHNRRDFEQWLSQRDGVEYMIVDGATFEPPAKNGVWLIRKQDRKKVAGRDELAILGTYFLVRENMYQAPSIADVVGNRLLTATTALSDFYRQASSLTAPIKQKTETPSQSRENSVALDVPAAQDSRALAVLKHSLQYADEYIDENPITGEPGHFSFSSSTAAVKKRKADEEAAKLKELSKPPAILKSERPPAVLTESKPKPDRKMSKMGERARKRKSRANAQTPGTPLSANPISKG